MAFTFVSSSFVNFLLFTTMFSVQRLFIKRFQLVRHSSIATGRLTVNEGHPFRGSLAWRKDYLDGSGSSSARYLSSSSSRSMSSMSTNNSTIAPSLIGTPFASNPEAARLLDGLDVHSIPADGDGHLLTVYSKAGGEMKKRPIVLLHGRTWYVGFDFYYLLLFIEVHNLTLLKELCPCLPLK